MPPPWTPGQAPARRSRSRLLIPIPPAPRHALVRIRVWGGGRKEEARSVQPVISLGLLSGQTEVSPNCYGKEMGRSGQV